MFSPATPGPWSGEPVRYQGPLTKSMPLQLDLALLVVFAASIHAIWNAVVKASDDRHLTFAAILSAGILLGLPAAFFVEPPPAAAWP